jgi:cell wall-associated NlpC family hydrolase
MFLTTVIAAMAIATPAAAPAQTSAKPSAEKRSVLGKLGRATKKTTIRYAPSSSARAYYTVSAKDYLVIRTAPQRGWYQVLLQNGKYGYASTAAIEQLPYEVTSKPKTSRGQGYVASRGGDARSKMADYSLKFQGTPYVWGGNDELNGIDCSGFVKKMYGKIGLSLPRTAAEQALVGKPIYNLEDLQKGDRLYFWDKKRGKIGHTGIYLGDGNFVHSSSGRGGVATDYLGSDRWLKILVAARR